MRIAAITLIGAFVLMPGVSPGWTAPAGQTLSAGQATELSAQTEKKVAKKKAKKKIKTEKVEYMKSAAPPEPKK
ncbi:MAG TPA: hypothetical protein VHD59_12225 [Pseudolabrys sp.]|jgi:hypothetical protein|nr:hypothetical protein [Pseudolabrys sp.]